MKPKFNIGDKVRVAHPTMGNWEGVVYWSSMADDIYEYKVTNAPEIVLGFPVLVWEHEMELLSNE